MFAESVRGAGGGPVADVGCGPGRVTGHLQDLGVDAFGIDISLGPDEDVPGAVIFARSHA